jgi:hypothetical protein
MKRIFKIVLFCMLIFCLIPQFVNAQQSRSFAIISNPLGLLQFGPTVSAQLAVTPNTFIGPTIRFAGFGILSHLVITSDELKVGSMSAGLHLTQFISNPSSSRYYIGGILEYGWGGSRGDVGYSYEWESKSSALVVMANFGNRWRFSSGFFVNFGVFAGFAKELNDRWWELRSPNIINDSEDNLYIIGMVELSVGIEK